MPLAQAADQAVAAGAVLEEHDRRADRRALDQLALWIQASVCPKTAVESLDRFKWAGQFLHQPEAIHSDLAGVTHLFGDEAGLLAAVARGLRRRGFYARLAIAGTAGAAWGLAHYARSVRRSDSNGGFEFFVAESEDPAAPLRTLPCQALRLSPDQVRQLDRLGIETVGRLMQLPRDGVATRLGQGLVDRLSQALGEVDEPIPSLLPPDTLSASLDMEYPTDALDLVHDRMGRLTDQAIAPLHKQQRGVLRLAARMELIDHPPLVFQVGLFAPTLDVDHLTRLLIGGLPAYRMPAQVTRLTVSVTGDAPLAQVQASIFGDALGGDTSGADDSWMHTPEAARLIDALAGRLGEAAVCGVRVRKDPLPERSVEEFPLTRSSSEMTGRRRPLRSSVKRRRGRRGTSASTGPLQHSAVSSKSQSDAPPHHTDVGRRPLTLLPEPRSIAALVDGKTPAAKHGFPSRFRDRGKSWWVSQHWGPERIETGWWTDQPVRRDYFRVELRCGSRWWVFRDLRHPQTTSQADPSSDAAVTEAPGPWYLHGWFD